MIVEGLIPLELMLRLRVSAEEITDKGRRREWNEVWVEPRRMSRERRFVVLSLGLDSLTDGKITCSRCVGKQFPPFAEGEDIWGVQVSGVDLLSRGRTPSH